MNSVAIVDYGMGNLQSVRNAFEFLGASVDVTDNPARLAEARRVVLPGVGAFATGMKNLKERRLDAFLRESAGKKPLLGICLGMQLLAAYLMFETDIYGTKGRLRLVESGAKAEVWEVVDHPVFSGYKSLKSKPPLEGDLSQGLPNLVSDLIRAVEKKGARPHCTGRDGRASLEVAAALRRSAEQGGKRVSLPLRGKVHGMKLVSR